MTKTAVKQSRAKNSMRNTLFAAISYSTKMILQFAVRAVFIRYFIVEYLGVNGLFTNILSVLSLAELGVGNAIVYSMYKPIADNSTEKIKSLMALYRRLYLIIALAITVLGLALIPALPYLIKDAPNIDINLTVVYVLFLAQTVIGYFFAYRRSLVFAYQRNDIESKVSFVAQIILSTAQVLIIIFWHNFYAYTAAVVLCNAIDAVIVYLVSYKLFPEIKGKAKKLDKTDTKEIAKNTGAMVCHKLGGAIVFSTDSIVISAFIGAAVLGIYSNYTLVITSLGTVVNLFLVALKSSIGNYIAKKSAEDTYKLFNALNLVLMWFVGFIFIGLMCCFQDFILIFTGNTSYLLPYLTVFLICINFYFTQSRWMTNTFKECAGLFWNDRYKPLFEAGINLGLDFLLVYYMGIDGVLLATIISTLTTSLWVEPFVLYKNLYKKKLWRYFARYAVYILVTAVALGFTFVATYWLPNGNAGWFILKFLICLIVPNAVFLLIFFKTKEFSYLFNIIKTIFKKGEKPMKTVGVVLSGGIGARFGADTPKQYCCLRGKEVIAYPIAAMKNAGLDQVIVACAGEYREKIENTYEVQTCEAGSERNVTVYNALAYIREKFTDVEAVVFVDAARPLLTAQNLQEIVKVLRENDGVITCAKITDSLGEEGRETTDRNNFYLIQTPEAFKMKVLEDFDSTSDKTAIVQQVKSQNIVKYYGLIYNLKITYPHDIKIAEIFLEEEK